MKALAKPLSSPGRAEKFPTPLMMRFLRTNVGSRSRGRSRSSPMFILRSKKNGNAAAINETQQEPSSPKVTCIGQVRVRRSSKNSSGSSKSKKKGGRSRACPRQAKCSCCPSSCCCSCSFTCCGAPRTRFCHGFTSRFHKLKSFCNPFRKWVSFFRFGYCKKVNTRDDSSRFGSIHAGQNHVTAVTNDLEDTEQNVKETQLNKERKEGFLESSSPPRNALLLTRCRSAPYRSSSLASRFWGSPLRSAETETPKNEPEEAAAEEEEGMGRPVSPNLVNEEAESRINSGSQEESEELDSSSNGKLSNSKDSNHVQDLGTTTTTGRESIHPLLLTRCKSEPARTGERLNPEANFFTQRRSDTAESCLELPKN